MKYIVSGIILAILIESLGYSIADNPIADTLLMTIFSYIFFKSIGDINFCTNRHSWYIDYTYRLPNGNTQVLMRCRKCNDVEENEGKASPQEMLEWEKKHNICGCRGDKN